MEQVSDEELERIAAAEGPQSMAARALALLKAERAKDRQVVAFRFANSYAVAPVPDSQAEHTLQMLEWEVSKPKKP